MKVSAPAEEAAPDAPAAAQTTEPANPPQEPLLIGGVPVGIAPTVFMKGGSSTGNYDREMARKKANADQRRKHQDLQMAVGSRQGGADGSMAKIGSQRMVTPESPKIVLFYQKMGADCISEVTQVPHPSIPGALDTTVTLVCPKCLERGLPMGEAQLIIRESHRKFTIDERKRGPKMVHSGFQQQLVNVCGTLTVHDVVRCSNYNCTWAVRIDDSIVREV